MQAYKFRVPIVVDSITGPHACTHKQDERAAWTGSHYEVEDTGVRPTSYCVFKMLSGRKNVS